MKIFTIKIEIFGVFQKEIRRKMSSLFATAFSSAEGVSSLQPVEGMPSSSSLSSFSFEIPYQPSYTEHISRSIHQHLSRYINETWWHLVEQQEVAGARIGQSFLVRRYNSPVNANITTDYITTYLGNSRWSRHIAVYRNTEEPTYTFDVDCYTNRLQSSSSSSLPAASSLLLALSSSDSSSIASSFCLRY